MLIVRRILSILILATLALDPRSARAYDLRDYGRDCARELGVELPPIDCTKGDLLPIEENGKPVTDHVPAHCDKPSLADPPLGCTPGGRVLRIENKNARGETVYTVVACRRREHVHPIDSPIFENISIIQYNSANNKVCWFQIRKHDRGRDFHDIPPPYTADPARAKKYADFDPNKLYLPLNVVTHADDSCILCHDSQVFLRTPWIDQATAKNKVPRFANHGKLVHVGEPFQIWNQPALQPARIRVKRAAYDAKFPPAPGASPDVAPADACTRCHSIGKSPLAALYHQGTCDDLVKDFTVRPGSHFVTSVKLSDWGKHFPFSTWMPPTGNERFGTGLPGWNRWRAYYARALGAVTYCCAHPGDTFNGQRICTDPPEEGAPSDLPAHYAAAKDRTTPNSH